MRATARAMNVPVKIPRFPFWSIWIPSVACEAICKPLGISPPLFPRRADWYRKTRQFDISRAKRELGFHPEIGLDEGLRRTAEWYWDEGLLPRPRGAKGSGGGVAATGGESGSADSASEKAGVS